MVWDKIKEIVGSIKNCPQMVPFSLIFKHLYQYTFSQQNRAIVELYPQQPLYYYIKKLNSLKEMFKHYSKYGPVFCYRLQKYRFKYIQVYKNQPLLQFKKKKQKNSEWTQLMITCSNISYKNVKAKYRVKFQSTQVWKISQIFWNLSVRLLSHRFDKKTVEIGILTGGNGKGHHVHSQKPKIIPCGKTFSRWLSFFLFYVQPTMRWCVNWCIFLR